MKMTMNYWTKFLFLVFACISTSILLITNKHTRGPEDIIFTAAGSRKERFGVLFIDKYKKTSSISRELFREQMDKY